MPSRFALLAVTCVLEQQEGADALQNLGWLISSFLGPDPNMSLREACTFGSTALLDWIWSSSCTSVTDRPAKWSLNSFLRSDPLYKRFEFIVSAKAAARRGDLPVTQWLFVIVPSCEELESVLYEAAVWGHLEVLQFLLDHADGSSPSVKKRKVVDGNAVVQSKPIRVMGLGSTLGSAVEVAIQRGHYAVARWIYENEYCRKYCEADVKVTCRAMDFGGRELADLLILPADVAENYTEYSLRDELVGPLLECCRNGDCAARAIRGLAKIGRLDLLQQVAQLHPPRAQAGWEQYWRWALGHACERGDLPMIQWLMSRPTWLDVNKQKWGVRHVQYLALERGHIAAMDYLHSHEYARRNWSSIGLLGTLREMRRVVRYGHLDSVKWLLEHGWRAPRRFIPSMIVMAAKFGHLEIMQFFLEMISTDVGDEHRGVSFLGVCDRAIQLSIEYGHFNVAQWLLENQPQLNSRALFDLAALHGRLEVMQWLYENRQDEFVSSNTIGSAATHGHFEVVRWLYDVRPEHSMSGILDSAVQGNNMELVQWLHENTDASCTTNAMDFAARNGNLAMLKWLHAHRSKGCTAKAIEFALGLDNTRVASWLVQHFPELVPQEMVVNCQMDVLIFVRVHFPHILPSSRKLLL